MFNTLPSSAQEFGQWTWPQMAPYYEDLLARPLTAANVEAWLSDWTRIASLLDEVTTRFNIATTVNTADEESERRMKVFLDEIVPPMSAAEQALKEKLIASGLEPQGFSNPLRKLRTEAALYRESNVPLLAELRKLSLEYDKLSGARTAEWDGQTLPIPRLAPFFQNPDRSIRERAWRAYMTRILQDSEALRPLWRTLIMTRHQVARNAGFENFRDYTWQKMFRFDYTPDDAKQFHASIEQVVVPATQRLYERRRELLGLDTTRPWDLSVDAYGGGVLHPAESLDALQDKMSAIFGKLDPKLAEYFDLMRAENLLDLDSRPNKASGGYSLTLAASKRSFIFTNSVGTHDDVLVLLHEGGHSFHAFESLAAQPYFHQIVEQMVPMEFLEVASMSMEFLGAPYFARREGGFYSEADAARAQIEKLREVITFWPYMAAVDAIQHWIYENPAQGADIDQVDQKWSELVDRFQPYTDWRGLDAEKRGFWHRQSHIFQDPFYYIEYGIAQLGAIQVWANATRDRAGAVAAYRRALALGGSATLPELYTAAGANFAFDADTLRSAVDLIESTMERLAPQALAEQGG